MPLLQRAIYKMRSKFLRHVMYRDLKVPVHGTHVILPIKLQLLSNRYEAPEINALLKLLRPSDKVLELGVGLGVVSGLAAKACPDCEILSFEANPNLIDPIKELHKINKIDSVKITNAILVSKGGGQTREFFIHRSFAEGSLFSSSETVRSVKVDTINIKEVLSSFQPDILVIDIEGGESELFSNLDLTGVRCLVIELHPKIISRSDEIRIFKVCAQAGLYPRIELSSENVVAFESNGSASSPA